MKSFRFSNKISYKFQSKVEVYEQGETPNSYP
ncbi:hypothetical protein SAMN04515695_4856 [Pseudovibrio sp. Tun.PSC04-5.I4]|nr:hypothetical protein SAMN04515695_4856 [Pseudovibrio sp. Tun.PSC04-5.I4]